MPCYLDTPHFQYKSLQEEMCMTWPLHLNSICWVLPLHLVNRNWKQPLQPEKSHCVYNNSDFSMTEIWISECELGQCGSCGSCWPQWRVVAKAVVWKGKSLIIYLLNIGGKFQTAPVDIPKTSAPREFANSLLIINAQVLFSGCGDSTLRSKCFHGLTECRENLELICI